jgi:hypothetical protein
MPSAILKPTYNAGHATALAGSRVEPLGEGFKVGIPILYRFGAPKSVYYA